MNRVEKILKIIQSEYVYLQDEGYQGLNKWFKKDGAILCVYEDMGLSVRCFGYWQNKWYDSIISFKSALVEIPTESEIKEALLKGCEQKGIVEGVNVRALLTNQLFSFNDGKIKISDSGDLMYYVKNGNSFLIFDNGKFAEVVKETELQEYKKTHNVVNPLKDSADKELTSLKANVKLDVTENRRRLHNF